MANDGGEQVTAGVEHILILGGLSNLSNHLAFNGDQVEDMTTEIVAAQRQLTPGEQRGGDRRLRQGLTYFGVGEGEEAILNCRESNCVGNGAHLQRVPNDGSDP